METESRVYIKAALSMVEGIQDSESMRLKGLVGLGRLNGMGPRNRAWPMFF